MRRRPALLAGALMAALALAACGEKHDTLTPTASAVQPLNVMLDWFPNADHVGLYEALANGGLYRCRVRRHASVPPMRRRPRAWREEP